MFQTELFNASPLSDENKQLLYYPEIKQRIHITLLHNFVTIKNQNLDSNLCLHES